MTFRTFATLFALALPIAAQSPATQSPVSAETEAIFYKAFYLDKGQHDPAGAMTLYQQFLDKAPEHALAKDAATLQYRLLERTGKAEARDAFKAKYSKLLADVQPMPAGGGAGGGDNGRDGEGRRGPGGEGRMDPQARMAELEAQLAKAKESGDDEQVKRLTAQIERMKNGGGGRFGGGSRGGFMGMLRGDTKLAELSAEQMKELKDNVAQAGQNLDRMRQFNPELADKMEAQLASLKAALDANKLEDAQKAVDEMRAAMESMRGNRGGRGGRGQGGGQGNGGSGNGPQGGNGQGGRRGGV